jgi:hypothetical protein
MNLQDKYLAQYDFNEVHQTVIAAPPQVVYPFIRNLDFSGSWIIRLLFFLRGLPTRHVSLNTLADQKFLVLEEVANEGIIIGLVGQFWKPIGNLQPFTPDTFSTMRHQYAKATWSFSLQVNNGKTTLVTETRIACPDIQTKKKFSHYWVVVRPFSGLIRREMLKAIRIKAERQVRQLCA